MKICYAFMLSAVLFIHHAVAQIALEQHTISSASNHYASSSIQIDWTIGELAAVTTIGNDDFIFTQGLHQPDKFSVGINELEINRFNVHLYPNPTVDEISLELIGQMGNRVVFQIFDASGREVTEAQKVLLSSEITKVKLPIKHLAQGAYFIYLSSENRKFSTAISFIKAFSYD